MGITEIQQFITIPNLPDVVVFIISLALLIGQIFTKAFVKKDNITTLFNVRKETENLNDAKKQFEEEKLKLEQERQEFQKELKEFRKEQETIKKSIRTLSGNVKELVSNGTANEIAKNLPVAEDNSEIENKEDKG